jgi:hypothetical protein
MGRRLGFVPPAHQIPQRVLPRRLLELANEQSESFALKSGMWLTISLQTAAAITAQTPVLVENLTKLMETGQVGKAVYDGYTSCPLFTGYGSVSSSFIGG